MISTNLGITYLTGNRVHKGLELLIFDLVRPMRLSGIDRFLERRPQGRDTFLSISCTFPYEFHQDRQGHLNELLHLVERLRRRHLMVSFGGAYGLLL